MTVDAIVDGDWETLARIRRIDTRQCGDCHGRSFRDFLAHRPNFDGLDLTAVKNLNRTDIDWVFVNRLRDSVKGKLLLKGILTQEDAVLATTAGIDAIIVSNHGGRFGDNGQATIDALPEIIEAVGGRISVLIDSGFRQGTDVVKALDLGARAICIGRPYFGGLPRLVRAASGGFSTSCARRHTPRCSGWAPRRYRTLRRGMVHHA